MTRSEPIDVQPGESPRRPRVAVTGATGYIGGRLAPALLREGYPVRCVVRSARKLTDRPWIDHPLLEITQCDLGAPTEDLARALAGCEAAFYLVHSMVVAGDQYAEEDMRLARGFAEAARVAGVQRIIYLGGLGEMGDRLSAHLASRRDVESALREGGVPVTTLRAAMIIGSGSAAVEILRYIVERLPVMVTPRWVSTRCQPIAVRNALEYLVRCVSTPETEGRTLEIGGSEVVTYAHLMKQMAQARGLPRRWVIPVPLLTPRLSSLWIHLVTPVSARLARPLAEGLRNEVVVRDDEAARLMPQRLLGVRESIDAALGKVSSNQVETAWTDAGVMPGDPDWAGGTVFVDERSIEVDAPPSAVFRAVTRIGGENGWYAADWLWRVRGVMDRLVGGPGLRRGRRHPETLAYGDALDFWRVIGVERDRSLDLRAEMRLPGVAKLSFTIEPRDGARDGCRLVQTARFRPKGLLGIAYWYCVLPLHGVVFRGMLRGFKRAAESSPGSGGA